jgi:hypothetical protein
MNKQIRIGFSEAEVDVILKLTSAEVVKQIHHKVSDPILVEVMMKATKAKEKFNSKERKE